MSENATKKEQTDTTQPADQLNSSLSNADTRVSKGLTATGLVHQARLSLQNRTLTDLTALHGANDPRVKAAAASVSATQATIKRVASVGQETSIPSIKVAENGWALQGRVIDGNSSPLPKYTVYLADSKNEFVAQYGFAYTDVNGNFMITYSGDSVPGAVYIGILNSKSQPVYLSKTAFKPVKGQASFQRIQLVGGGTVLGDPNAAIAAVAFPSKKRKSAGLK